jgi:hypothetical protein
LKTSFVSRCAELEKSTRGGMNGSQSKFLK